MLRQSGTQMSSPPRNPTLWPRKAGCGEQGGGWERVIIGDWGGGMVRLRGMEVGKLMPSPATPSIGHCPANGTRIEDDHSNHFPVFHSPSYLSLPNLPTDPPHTPPANRFARTH